MSTQASAESVVQKMADGVAAAKSAAPYSDMTKKTGIIILIILAMFVIILIVVYIVNMVRKSSMKSAQIVEKIIPLDDPKYVPQKISSNAMEMTFNGHEFSYSFWIYLSAHYNATTDHKLIMCRGNSLEGSRPAAFGPKTNPIIFMHKTTNVMYFALSTTEVKTTSNTFSEILAKNANGQFTNKYLISHIDYVPLQRWVHVVMSVRDASMTIFMDGDIYSVVNVADIPWSADNARPIIHGTEGEGVIGDAQNLNKGFLSKMEFFNYALTQDDVKGIYKQGPIKQTFLGRLGLGNYGVRAPIYKIEAEAKSL